MNDLDIIVPVYNEQDSIDELISRINSSLGSKRISYRIIFVDDNSTDNTAQVIKKFLKNDESNLVYKADLNENSPEILLHTKIGKKGKAYSIIEGSRLSNAKYIAMIDGDLQYPPEALPELFEVAKKNGVAVANRTNSETSILRKIGSKVNIVLFEKLLHGFNCDTQSGLKVFNKEIIESISESDVSGWAIDMPLLKTALELGYSIGCTTINFQERKTGTSKVNFVKVAKEIGINSVKLKFRKKRVYPIKAHSEDNAIGAGFAHKGKRFITYTNLSKEFSALETFTKWQKIVAFSIFGIFISGIIFEPIKTLIFLLGILTSVYFIDLIFSIYLLYKTLTNDPVIKISKKEIKEINEETLPFYTILCPLYKEANVLADFTNSVSKLDWPTEKLDIILLLEEDDKSTINKAYELNLPNYFRILVIPHSLPKTKPKACNYGLINAKGDYLVVYDAEDRPDRDQLKKVYIGFKKVKPNVICLQSKLNYYNSHQNILTRLFTAEYSLWFDLILPGLQSIETTIPLGGTSNHFKIKALRYLDGWDTFNVTEDCDLGTRLFRKGFRTGILDSTTLEEANSNMSSWLKQRSRWIKGYLQTYLVHMRHPFEFIKRNGKHAFIFQLVIGVRMTFMIINPLLWLMTFSYFALNKYVGSFIESLYPPQIFYIGAFSLIFGNFIYLYIYMIGCAIRKKWELLKYILLIPLYWLLASFSAIMAFYQLFVKPHYWEKTTHGLFLKKTRLSSLRLTIEVTGIDIRKLSGILVPLVNKLNFFSHFVLDFLESLEPSLTHSQIPENNLKILMFNWRDIKHLWAGGAEVYIHEISKRWVRKGHKVTLFCSWDGVCPRDETVDGVQIIRRGGFITVYLWAFLYYFFRFRRSFNVIVDCENGIPFFTPLYSRLPKILLVHHIHTKLFKRRYIRLIAYTAEFIESILMPIFYRSVKAIAVSESSRKDMVALGFGDRNSIEVVNPGIEIKKFHKSEKTETPTFLYLGRLKPWKSIEIALYAMMDVLKKFPKAKLSIAGYGESRKYLEKIAKDLKITDSVEFLGRVSEEVKIKLLGESWAFIYPSIMEGWGITAIEANACGTPVIASNVPGLRDSVKNPTSGFLIPPSDVNALREKMELIITDSQKRDFLSRESIKWATNFSWDDAASRFLKAVESEFQLSVGIKPVFTIVEEVK